MRKSQLILMAMAAGLAALSACGGKKDPTLRFRYWGDGEEAKIIAKAVEGFEKENPGLKVRMERKPADANYANLLTTEFATGNAPDVIFLGDLNCDKLIEKGRFQPLDEFLNADPSLKKADYYKAMVDRFSRDGKLYLLPRDIAPVNVIYYNKGIFDKAKLAYPKDSWTWKDFKATAQKLTVRKAEGSATQYGYSDDGAGHDVYIYTSGGKLVDDTIKPTRIVMDSPKSLRGLMFRFELYHQLKVMPSGAERGSLVGGGEAMFMAGTVAMYYSGIWKTPTFRNIKDFDWDVAPFPAGPDGNREAPLSGSGYGINVDAKDKQGAWKLVRYLSGETGQGLLATTGLAQPALKALAASKLFIDDQKPLNKKFLLKSAELGYTGPALGDWTEYNDSIWRPQTDAIWVTGFNGDAVAVIKKAVADGNERLFGAGKTKQ